MILEQKPVQKQKYLNILLDTALAALVIFLMFQVHHSVLAVISPFFYALILAYLINPLVRWLARHKIPRLLAIILVFLLILGILTGLGIAFIPGWRPTSPFWSVTFPIRSNSLPTSSMIFAKDGWPFCRTLSSISSILMRS